MKMKQLTSQLKKLDFFGKNISLTYRNNERYKTKYGAFFTLIMGVIMLWFVTTEMLKIGTINSIYREEIAITSSKSINPGKLGFAMAIGFIDHELPPSIAKWSFNYVQWPDVEHGKRKDRKFKNHTEVGNFPCSENYSFWSNGPSDNHWQFKNLRCSNVFENDISGQLFDK